MRFTKMHGLGNDYLYVYGEVPENVAELSVRLSDRHFGVGSDGMIFIAPAQDADFSMRIFNADGSEAQMCGNGIRCVGKYVYDRGYTDKTTLQIATLAGIKTLRMTVRDGQVESATVDMGKASVSEERELVAAKKRVRLTPVSMGNPHAVIFVGGLDYISVETLGPAIEHHTLFPHGVNVEFVEVLEPQEIRMLVWERGSGITLACGTGACASVAAAVHKGYCPSDVPITVHLDGGPLTITVSSDYEVTMHGPATTVFDGEVAV